MNVGSEIDYFIVLTFAVCRFACRSGKMLRYFTGHNLAVCKGEVSLQDATLLSPEECKSVIHVKNCIGIKTPYRTYYMKTNDDSSPEQWMASLAHIVAQSQ